MRTIYEESELTLSPDDYQFGDPSTADDKAILKGLSLFLTDKIGMRVYVKTFVDSLSNDDYMVFSYADENETVYVSEAKNVKILDSDGKSIDVLAFEIELCTDQMTEEVSFHLNIGFHRRTCHLCDNGLNRRLRQRRCSIGAGNHISRKVRPCLFVRN